MIAMAIAVLSTFFVADHPVVWMIVGAMVLGAVSVLPVRVPFQ
jgi:NAD(P) transhydrogenase subunit beta